MSTATAGTGRADHRAHGHDRRVQGRAPRLRLDGGAGRAQPQDRAGRAAGAARPVRLRQDDRAAAAGRIRPADVGRDPGRRQGHLAGAGQQARHGHGVPVLQPVPDDERAGQRRVRAADARRVDGAPGARARSSCSIWSGCPSTSRSTRTRCRAASSSASRWPARSRSRRGSCCSTSRCRRSTPRCASSCATRSGASSSSSASPPCSSRTTRKKRCRWPTGSASCASGRLEQCATPAELYDRPATPFVAEFVGTMNRLAGVAEAGAQVRIGRQLLPADGQVPARRRRGDGARAARGDGRRAVGRAATRW